MTRMKGISIVLTLVVIFGISPHLFSHCQVPCGIFDDQARLKMMAEHIITIEKAMVQIEALSKESPVNYNQIVRWVTTKDTHADEMSEIITYYFMAQRVKPVETADAALVAAYQEQLELLHHLLVYTMKTKQSTDVKNIATLRELLGKFEKAYFKKA